MYVSAGPSKLPELGKELGKTVKSFQTAAKVRGRAVTLTASPHSYFTSYIAAAFHVFLVVISPPLKADG